MLAAEDTGRFAPYVDLYLNMLNMQLTYDALRIIGFDIALMESLGGEMNFMRELAHAGKIAQGLIRRLAKKAVNDSQEAGEHHDGRSMLRRKTRRANCCGTTATALSPGSTG